MKNKIPPYAVKPLLILIPLDILLILLRWFMPLDFAAHSASVGMRILGVFILIALIPINYTIVLAIGGLLLERNDLSTHMKPTGDGTKVKLKGVGKFSYCDWWAHGYFKPDALTLFGKEHPIYIRMETRSKAIPITEAQIQAYQIFFKNYSAYQAELESLLVEQGHGERFVPTEIIIRQNGNYTLKASDDTLFSSRFEFLVTFDPMHILYQQMSDNEWQTRFR